MKKGEVYITIGCNKYIIHSEITAMAFPISIQLFSLRDDLERDPRATLTALKEMGYDGIEPYGGKSLYGFTPEEFIHFMNELGLKVPSAHISYETLLSDTDDTLAFHKALGCKYLAIPYMVHEKLPGGSEFDCIAENMSIICEKGKEYGIQICYHNHEKEFEKLDGKYIMEHLLESVPEMKAEYDTAWISVMEQDPVEYIRAHKERCALLHLKDYYREFDIKYKRGELRPVGYGVQNIPGLLDAAKEADVEWIVVEQDDPAFGKTNLECAKMSIEYLKVIQK